MSVFSTQCVLEASTETTAGGHAVLDVTGRVIQQMATVAAQTLGRIRCVKVKLMMELTSKRNKQGVFSSRYCLGCPPRAGTVTTSLRK